MLIAENITPLGKVAFWVKETARKTVRIFRSFTDKYSVIEDEVDDDSADEISPVFFNTSAMEQRNLLQVQCVGRRLISRTILSHYILYH